MKKMFRGYRGGDVEELQRRRFPRATEEEVFRRC